MLTTLNSKHFFFPALQMCLSCHWCTCWETLCFFLQVYQILVSFCLHWYHSVSNFCHGNIVVIFVTDSCVFCMLSVLVNSLWVSAEDLTLVHSTVMISCVCFLNRSGPVLKTVWFWSAAVCTICWEEFCSCCRTSCWRRWWTNWFSRRLFSSWSTTLLLSYSRASWRSAHVQ